MSQPTPNKELRWCAVEYPGYVKMTPLTAPTKSHALEGRPQDPLHEVPDKASLENVLQTLGGLEAMREAAFTFTPSSAKADSTTAVQGGLTSAGQLELRYRPSDPYSHPINGNFVDCSSILVKFTRTLRRRRRRPDALDTFQCDEMATASLEPEETKVDTTCTVISKVDRVCRFRAMADYQFPMHEHKDSDPLVKLRYDMQDFNIEEISKFRLRPDTETPLLYPPPVFSRAQVPTFYGFKQSPYFSKSVGEGEASSNNDDGAQSKTLQVFTNDSSSVPTTPLKEAVDAASQCSPESLEALRALFAERPIWTRYALTHSLQAEHVKDLLSALPTVAYFVNFGAWRDTWVQLGFDFRANRNSRLYQVLSFRLPRKDATRFSRGRVFNLVHAVRTPSTTEASMVDNEKNMDADGSPLPPPHVFDGAHFSGQTTTFQLIDIKEPELVSMINTSHFTLSSPQLATSGWYTKSHCALMRYTLKKKVMAIVDPESAAASRAKNSQEANKIWDENEALLKQTSAGKKAGEKSADDAVEARVEEMMKAIMEDGDMDDIEDDLDEFGYLDSLDGLRMDVDTSNEV